MAQNNPDLAAPRTFFDGRGLVRNIIMRRSWFIAFILIDIFVLYSIFNSEVMIEAWDYIVVGIGVTVQITILSFLLSLVIGLIVALGRISKNVIIYNVTTLYVELFRGLPLLVIILIFAFVVTPALVDLIAGTETLPGIPFLDNFIQSIVGIDPAVIDTTTLRARDIDPVVRIVLAFAVTYGAFMSEVFRAGIESIGKGQMEAARSLGMTYVEAMRYVILPQAIRNVLPALANNFILLLKDTSLASVVAVPEISHLTRQYASNRFRYPEGLLILSFIYANVTILMSLGVIYLEHRLQQDKRDE
ncbi:MAG: amino acid ABC transporter permease [Chloroflexi bacterium]|jgi:polar amino acid transport system permease protein|uniref:amino acid ABC transporter permease n=1 Tax=Candidatus Flexifilum breve TaxID=3140694 RepID=UPI0031376BD8|nr:amino acid ABC transporter permease [Chloroflexota bacterium]